MCCSKPSCCCVSPQPADAISAQPVAKLGGYHRECVRDCSWHPHLPMLATGGLPQGLPTACWNQGCSHCFASGAVSSALLLLLLQMATSGASRTCEHPIASTLASLTPASHPCAVSFDGACTLWEPEVPGDAEMAGEEAAASAEQQQAGSGQRAARRGSRRRAADLPAPGSDQLMW